MTSTVSKNTQDIFHPTEKRLKRQFIIYHNSITGTRAKHSKLKRLLKTFLSPQFNQINVFSGFVAEWRKSSTKLSPSAETKELPVLLRDFLQILSFSTLSRKEIMINMKNNKFYKLSHKTFLTFNIFSTNLIVCCFNYKFYSRTTKKKSEKKSQEIYKTRKTM